LKVEIHELGMRCSCAVFERATADQRKDAGKMGAGQGQAESSGGAGLLVRRYPDTLEKVAAG
jgi:hypothetical protein